MRRVLQILAVVVLAAVVVGGFLIVRWGQTVQALTDGGMAGLRSSQPVVSTDFANALAYRAMFKEGAPMTVGASLRNETGVDVTIDELFNDERLPGSCGWVVDRIRTTDGTDVNDGYRDFTGGVVLPPGGVLWIQARMVMTCRNATTRGGGTSSDRMAVGYTVAGLFPRQDYVDTGFEWGWVNYRDPEQYLDDHTDVWR
jgi:hypothetical protein